MTILFHRRFEKQLMKAPKKIQERVYQALDLFLDHPYHARLNNHALTGKYSGMRSINITGDLRAVFRQESDGVCLFVIMDNHNNLYS